MRVVLWIALTLTAAVARAEPRAPLGVTVECEAEGRTKACPAFLLGFIDDHPILRSAPRSSADVVVYASATEVALVDRIHLRFVGNILGAPPVVELDVDVDSRADDDAQRVQLEPGFLRGVALFVAARHPGSVKVELAPPEDGEVASPVTTPWGVTLALGGFGNRTQKYRSYNAWGGLELSRLTARSRWELAVEASGGLNRQPPLMLEDGTAVSLDTEQWAVASRTKLAWLYDDRWSLGAASTAWRDDPKGQYRFGWVAKAAVEWDKFRADDPRGNRLSVMYLVTYNVEGYNLRNELGERFAQYPSHGIVASGSVRKDKISIGISLAATGELIHVRRRHRLSASPFIEWKLGNHVDLSVSFSATKRELPGPDASLIDPADYEQLSRLSYAEPLALNGSFNLSIHWDRTNGARNDRFSDL